MFINTLLFPFQIETLKDLAANWLPFGRIISPCKSQPETPLSFISICLFSCFNLSSNVVHLTVGVVNNVGKPWERVAYLMQNSARAQKIPFLKKRKEKIQSCVIGLLFRFSQQGILVKLRFSYELSSNGAIATRAGVIPPAVFVWYEGRTPCLTKVPRLPVIKRSTTQQCNVMLIVGCAKTGQGTNTAEGPSLWGGLTGTDRNTGRFLMEQWKQASLLFTMAK